MGHLKMTSHNFPCIWPPTHYPYSNSSLFLAILIDRFKQHESPLCIIYRTQKSDIGTEVELGNFFNLHLCRCLLSDDIEILTHVVIFQYIISRLETPKKLKASLQKTPQIKTEVEKTSITYIDGSRAVVV